MPWSESEQQPAVTKPGPLLVQPRVAMSSQDRVGIALPELKMQRFGSKCEDCDEAPAPLEVGAPRNEPLFGESFFQVAEQTVTVQDGQDINSSPFSSPLSSFGTQNDQETPMQRDVKNLHIGSSLQNGSSDGQKPVVSQTRQVGEVAIDPQAPAQDNSTAPNELSVGFVAAAKPPPALSEVPPLPFMPDGELAAPGGHIHVFASIATQEVSGRPEQDAKAATLPAQAQPMSGNHAGATANGSLEDEADAWSNFTAAEALHVRNRDAEALGIDAAAETLPTLVGTLPPKETLASRPSGVGPTKAASQPIGKATSASAAATEPATVASPDGGILAHHNVLLLWLLSISSVLFIGGCCVACLGAGFLASFVWQRRLGRNSTRSQVEEMPLCRASEVERRLPASKNYDCIFSKPLSSCQLLRLEAVVEGPCQHSLVSPLTGQACVLYSVAVSRQLHDGIRPAPVAFSSGSIDFVISLKDAPEVRINLHAEEVSLFDMRRGRHVQRRSFAAAPDKWQDFILTHRAGTEWQTSAQLRADSSSLEFQECTLLCGTLATFVGELHRGSDGTLTLKPLPPVDVTGPVHARSAGLSERWRTSWECTEAKNAASRPPSPRAKKDDDACFEKVMASDDPALLEGASPLINGANALLRRWCPAKCGGRAMNLLSFYRGGKRPCSEKCPGGLEGHTL